MKSRSNDSAGPRSSKKPAETASARLLISVRSEQEVDDAIAGGADIVDLKEPRRGALAPTSTELWNSVSHGNNQHSAGRCCEDRSDTIRFSAALGESEQATSIAAFLPPTFAFAKVGPTDCDTKERLTELWSAVLDQLNCRTELVAVAYADHESARCLPAEQVFQLAAEFGFKRCLIDTLGKDGRSTVDHLGIDGLRRLASVVEQQRLWWTLAGSITLDQIEWLHRQSIWPDCFGVRGDVCVGDRQSVLSATRVKQWKQACVTRPSRVPSGS